MSESIFSKAIYLDDVPKTEWKNYIGSGYRSVCYTTDANKHGQIILFGFDLNGNPKTFICPWKSYVKYNVKFKTDEVDIYGHYVATKYFNSKYERDQYVKNANGLNIVECLKPESEFLHYMFDSDVLKSDFNKQPLRMHYFDIETEISDKFEKPTDARNRINMMTIYDSLTKKFYTWSLQKCSLDFTEDPIKDYPKDKFVVFDFFNNDEFKMLEHFLNWMEDNYADINITWNGKAYDIPYLVRRIENTLGKNEARRLSPVGRYFIKQVNHDNERADVSAEIEVSISGLFIADCLVLYRDKFGVAGHSLDGGYSLDNVGEHEGCGHKIKYDGTLKDLYLNDWQRFFEYNLRDVDLLKRIDDKCKMVSLARQITSFGLTDYNQIYGSIAYLIGSVMAFSKTEMGGKVFNSYMAEKKHFDSFEGAFVFPTVPGVYRDGIACVDFASLYPTNIRTVNASPETYVGKLLIQYKDELGNLLPIDKLHEPMFDVFDDKVAKADNIAGFYLKLPNEKYKQITLEQIRQLIKTKCIYTANNTLFLKHEVKWGVIAKWCEHFYNLRKSIKKNEMKALHILQTNTDLSDEEREKQKLIEENSHTGQIGVKAMINSIYGIMGTGHSPIANPDIAQSITRQGQFCNKSTEKYILKVFKENFGLDESIKTTAIGGDTDSQFIDLAAITNWLRQQKPDLPNHIHNWPKSWKLKLWDVTNKLVQEKINPYVRNLVKDYCHTTQSNVLTYELEYVSSIGIYEGKKHYATRKLFNEGDMVDIVKFAGIELKKAQVPKEMKAFLAEIYDGILLHDWSEMDYVNYTNELYNKFSSFSIDDVSFWKGYNTERQAIGFLQMQVGTTGIAKACTYYNQIIDKMKLGKKYDEIRVGDKVRFCYIEPTNIYGINCIAYKPGAWPKEFNDIFKVDYHVMFNKIILDPLKRFREACKFENSDPSKQVVADVFSL